jgi:hypothetical protein
VGSTGNNIIEFRNGDPFLTEFRCEKGLVLFFTSGFSDYWSDITHRGIFSPLLHRAVTFLSGNVQNGETSHLAGLPLSYFVRPEYSEFSITIPDGETRKIIPSEESNNVFIEYTETYNAGIYYLLGDSDILTLFAVNPAVEYSDLNRNPVEKNNSVISLDASSPNVFNSILEARTGKELWKLFAASGLFLLLIELLIVRLFK